ncbi:unnamed protein product [Brassica napus]|uniref:(rape) hypothetical protein n=1 Tax=Brassica napus TaxID=3708 RepID=A0A816JT62_BRANA|nr:unnamed protein product [Brassica napus]
MRYEASLVLFADQFIGAGGYYTDMLRRLDAMYYDLLFVTPTLDINNPESPQWPGLLIDRGASYFAFEEPPSPKMHEAHAAAEEETLNTHGKLLLETEDIKKSESPELQAGLLIDGGRGCESSEKGTPKRIALSPLEPNTCYGRRTN